MPEPTEDAASTVTSKSFDELSAREFHDLVRLRTDVFVVEQECPYPELDGRDVDPGTEHHWITDTDGRAVCVARSLVDPDGLVRIGRVATDPSARGRGLAADLMRSILARIGDGPVVIDAQSHLHDWYVQFGFERCGDEFVEDGIPHIPMRRP